MNLGATAACLFVLFVAEIPALGAAVPPELVALAQRHRAAKTLTGTFTWQVRPIVDGQGPVQRPRAGSFALRAAGGFSIVVREPDGGAVDRWLSDGVRRWEVSQLSPEDPADVRGPFPCDDGDADYRRVVACLRLDLEALATDHVLEATKTTDGTVIAIQPQARDDGARGPQVVAIVIRLTPAGEPSSIDLDHSDGNRWRIVLTALKRDEPVEDRMFAP